MQPEKFVVYELKGESLRAARTLSEKMHSALLPATKILHAAQDGKILSRIKAAMEIAPILLGQNAVSIADAVRSFAQGDMRPLKDAFKEKYKTLYDATGQNHRAVMVKLIDGCPPRAYAHTPALYFHPGDDTRVYMYAPVDYKNHAFVPQDAETLSPDQADVITRGLWAHGWSEPVPVLRPAAPYGVQTPPDFDAALSRAERHPAPFDHRKTAKLLMVFNNIQKSLVELQAIPGVDNADDVGVECEIVTRPDNRPGLLARVFHKHTGETLTYKENAYFKPVQLKEFAEIQPQLQTADGMALQSLFDEIPPLPPADIWKICDDADDRSGIQKPPLPAAFLHLDAHAPWPFPKSLAGP